jgi:hypothetical protein
MFKDRDVHQAFLATSAVLCTGGLVLITAGIFLTHANYEITYAPLVVGLIGGALFLAGMGMALYIRWRMQT